MIGECGHCVVAMCLNFLSRFHDTGLDSAPSSIRACRFGGAYDSRAPKVYVLARAPLAKKQVSFVVAFETSGWKETHRQSCGPHGLCALATSNEGHYVAVGDLEGFVTILATADLKVSNVPYCFLSSLDILVCFHNQVLVRSKAHGIFVTSLVFLGSTEDRRYVVKWLPGYDCVVRIDLHVFIMWSNSTSVISVSADRACAKTTLAAPRG